MCYLTFSWLDFFKEMTRPTLELAEFVATSFRNIKIKTLRCANSKEPSQTALAGHTQLVEVNPFPHTAIMQQTTLNTFSRNIKIKTLRWANSKEPSQTARAGHT